VGGVVKEITKACVAENGIVRQFYPYAAGTTDPNIKWTGSPFTVNEYAVDPQDVSAKITFNRSLGTYTYDNLPGSDVTETYLNPPATGTGQYLIKVDQVSGTALTGTLGSWIDLYSAASHQWSLDYTVVGAVTALANISIAQDDGAGAPETGTTVVKVVTFKAEVLTESSINWNSVGGALVEIKEDVDADCVLTFNPDGYATGHADTSGSFNNSWHIDSPNVSDPENYTVNVSLVSGTSPTGSALGSDLTLDEVRQWTLLATTGENLSCSLDVTVSDGVTSVTKRVTMNSQRTEDALSEPAWTTELWFGTDAGYPQPAIVDVTAIITFNVDGTGKFEMTSSSMPLEEIASEDWFDTPPPSAGALNQYEVKVESTGSNSGSLDFGTWYRMTETRAFSANYTTLANQNRTYSITASVRKVGGASIDKPISVRVSQSGGGIIP